MLRGVATRARERQVPGQERALIWFRPFSLDHFYEKIFISFVLEQPKLLTSLGSGVPPELVEHTHG